MYVVASYTTVHRTGQPASFTFENLTTEAQRFGGALHLVPGSPGSPDSLAASLPPCNRAYLRVPHQCRLDQ